MKIPLSWLKDFVEIDLPINELVHRLTLAGLEVEEAQFVGLPLPVGIIEGHTSGDRQIETNVTGLAWDPEKIVVGAILEVMSHPDADRLVLCRLDDGAQEHIVLAGGPNLFPYKGKGPLEKALKVAYAREGAQIYDGHKPGNELTTLKRRKIRGVESYSMACSEKELGISDDHEGVIILDDDAPVGVPLADYMGDVVLDIAITPNIARNANILGVAREVAALTDVPLKEPSYEVEWSGPPLEGRVRLEIHHPELNPRFVLGLIEGVEICPSPYWVQRRLRLAGMRPINNIVDATNYVMLEIGEPLHAFDFDVLVERAGGETPTILTRLAEPGERLTTLDGVERELDDFTVLVADSAGGLSIAGVMGGAESEVSEQTTNMLLEGAAWNFINIRRTTASQKLSSDASYRFERGVHPAMAERGVRRGLNFVAKLAGGKIAEGLVDEYPLPPVDSTVEITPMDVERWLGINLEVDEIVDILRRLGFSVEVDGQVLHVTTPDHRLDISQGVDGQADLIEEIARIYGYDRIPETQIADRIPPQYGNPRLEREERVRDVLVGLGLQEVVTYRLTSPVREMRIFPPEAPPDDRPYVRLANPIASDRVVMRHSLLASVLEIVERNIRIRDRIALFEIGQVYLTSEEGDLPEEPLRLVIALSGPRSLPAWQGSDLESMDFYDLKGLVDEFMTTLHLGPLYKPMEHPSFHPGKCARILIGERQVGVLGELHPKVRERYDLPERPVVAAELDFNLIIESIPESHAVEPVPAFPPVLEDLAVVVDEEVQADEVETLLKRAGGDLLVDVKLFDLYRGEQIPEGKKSLAYSMVYQAPDRTLTDEEVSKVRARVIKKLETDLGAKLRD
ncbi:MAG: phenylalanine--tRNA ligase subunit beta [Anaerolineaceae bacterium]|nr:MAG: phenylalanine--tRNA ligase subunit beta [Anaerolineaceae bacterium]